MKKYWIILLLVCGFWMSGTPSIFAESGKIIVIVTEEIPGGNCVCAIGDESACKNNLSSRKYKCEVTPGLAGFQDVLQEITRYIIYIVLLLGVLGIVGLGIAWAFAGGDDIKAKSSLRKWGVNILIGLTILFLFSYILRFLAPWVYQ